MQNSAQGVSTCSCTCMGVRVSVMHLHPQSWIHGLTNTCPTTDNGAGAVSCANHQGRLFGFSDGACQSISALLFKGLPRPGGWSVPVRVRPFQPGLGRSPAEMMSSCILQRGLSSRTNESVNICVSRPTSPEP